MIPERAKMFMFFWLGRSEKNNKLFEFFTRYCERKRTKNKNLKKGEKLNITFVRFLFLEEEKSRSNRTAEVTCQIKESRFLSEPK
jgi:hypothetical protein